MNALEALNLGRKHKISPSILHTLLAVLSDPPMKPSDVAEQTGVTPSAVTGSLDVLQKLGFIERIPSRDDRRITLANPTLRAFEIFQPTLEEVEP